MPRTVVAMIVGIRELRSGRTLGRNENGDAVLNNWARFVPLPQCPVRPVSGVRESSAHTCGSAMPNGTAYQAGIKPRQLPRTDAAQTFTSSNPKPGGCYREKSGTTKSTRPNSTRIRAGGSAGSGPPGVFADRDCAENRNPSGRSYTSDSAPHGPWLRRSSYGFGYVGAP